MHKFIPQILFEQPGTTPSPDPGAGKPWFEGKLSDPADIGYYASRGWDKDPVVAAIEAGKAHRQAEKYIGIPTADLVRLPKDANADTLRPIYERLGVPKTKEEYDLTGVKDLDGKIADLTRDTAHKLNITKADAPVLAQTIAKAVAELTSADTAEKQAALLADRQALDASWGARKAANMVIAQNAAQKLGIDQAVVSNLENVTGYKGLMEMFLKLGIQMGEDKFVANTNGGVPGVMSKDMAAAKIRELQADKAWGKRYLQGGTGSAEFRELQNLIAIAHA